MIDIRPIKNDEELQKILRIREQVFIEEQKVPRERERDGLEDESTHFVVLDGDNVIGCARIRFVENKARLERIALLPESRSKGFGKQIIDYLVQFAKERNVEEIYLHGQVRIQKFYEECGFKPRGEIFMDGGMEHYVFFMNISSSSPQ